MNANRTIWRIKMSFGGMSSSPIVKSQVVTLADECDEAFSASNFIFSISGAGLPGDFPRPAMAWPANQVPLQTTHSLLSPVMCKTYPKANIPWPCLHYAGKVKAVVRDVPGSICQVVTQVPQVSFQRLHASDPNTLLAVTQASQAECSQRRGIPHVAF